MRIKRHLLVILFIASFRLAPAQADTMHYMYSFAGVNIGYGVNLISPATKVYAIPFWSKGGPTVNLSGLIALNESYFGIPFMLGYSSPAFDLTDYIGAQLDTSSKYSFKATNPGTYQVYYAMTGLNLKIPERTTREAIEIRLLVGPLLATQSDINYSYTMQGVATTTMQTHIRSATCVALAFSPGIGLGYKLTQHLAFMGNMDVMFTELKFNTSKYLSDNTRSADYNISMLSSMVYLHITGGLAYTLGRITPNISY